MIDTPEARLAEMRRVIKEEMVQQLLRQIGDMERQLQERQTTIGELRQHVEALSLDLHFAGVKA
jgi:hypothetical protein